MKEIAELSSTHNVRNMITEHMFAKINSVVYIARKNIA